MPEAGWTTAEAARALEALVPPGRRTSGLDGDDAEVLGLAGRESDVLVTFRYRRYPWVLGLGLPRRLSCTSTDEHRSAEAWAGDAATWLREELDTGVVARASRTDCGAFIELVGLDRPADARFYVQGGVEPVDDVAWAAVDVFEREGFDLRPLRAARAAGAPVIWVRAYRDARNASAPVGHAAAVALDASTAQLLFCDVAPGVPSTVDLDLSLRTAHLASWAGARVVRTSLEHPALDGVGFRRVAGRRELTTDFSAVDDDAYRRLLHDTRRWKPARPRCSWRARTTSRAGL